VLLPVRDRQDGVGRSAVSVLAQTFSDVELVVADGGSTDGTRDAVRTVADRRVRILDVPANRDGLRAGLEACRGEWTAVIDADTAARPQWLARCGMLLDRSGADVVYCGGQQHHADGSRSEIRPAPYSSRPGAYVARTERLRSAVDTARPGDLAGLDGGDDPPRSACTPETLLDWFDLRGDTPPEDDARRLQWALEAIDTLGDSPIPDVDLLARYATIGGVAAARLRRREEARALLRLARRMRPGECRPAARWLVASVPPLADLVWAPDQD
jgi:glycosyltransferase involved in cell wall biosynthesis